MGRRGAQREALQESPLVVAGETVRVNARHHRSWAPGVRWLAAGALSVGLMASVGVARAQDEAASSEEEAKPATESGQKIDQAKKQIEQLDYSGAQELLFQVVQSGKATSEEVQILFEACTALKDKSCIEISKKALGAPPTE